MGKKFHSELAWFNGILKILSRIIVYKSRLIISITKSFWWWSLIFVFYGVDKEVYVKVRCSSCALLSCKYLRLLCFCCSCLLPQHFHTCQFCQSQNIALTSSAENCTSPELFESPVFFLETRCEFLKRLNFQTEHLGRNSASASVPTRCVKLIEPYHLFWHLLPLL